MAKFAVGLLLIMGVALGTYSFLRSDSYPVAIVNYKMVTAGDFNRDYNGALSYYKAVIKTYDKNGGADIVLDAKKDLEIQKIVLDKLIEDSLVYQELKSRDGENLEKDVQDKIDLEIKNTVNLKEAAGALYGLSWEDFTKVVLDAQAERDILSEKLAGENKKLDQWLGDARKAAQVFVLRGGFSWQEGKIVRD